jgi:hypothetical protein
MRFTGMKSLTSHRHWATSRPNEPDSRLGALSIDQASETSHVQPGQSLNVILRMTGNGREPALQAGAGTMNAQTRLDNPAEELRFVALARDRALTTRMNVLLCSPSKPDRQRGG